MSSGGHALPTEQLGVGALLYRVTRDRVGVTWVAPDGSNEHFWLAAVSEVIPRLELLIEEMSDGMALARGRVPRLRAFASVWGRALIPVPVLEAPPDVLVIVPHAFLHDVPLHLVTAAGDSTPLGCRAGITYSSSMSMFTRCAARNPARHRDPVEWPPANPRPRRFAAGGKDVLGDRDGMFQAVPLMLAEMFAGRTTLFDELPPGLTRAAVKDAIADEPDVLMVVAHGHVDDDNPQMSGLLVDRSTDVGWRRIVLQPGRWFEFRDLPLADPPVGQRPHASAELLTGAELEVNAQIRSELVVLLACSAGSGRVREGDEPAGVAETFLRLGAVSVVAALWDTDYAASRDWTAAFFTAWAGRGHPKALAARWAMQELRAAVGDEHPELFGALTVRGDWA